MSEDAAAALKARLQADLREALRARETATVRVLRALVAEIDNAQAAPQADQKGYVVRAFGEAGVEVPRVALSAEQARALLAREADARRTAAAEMRRLGQAARADDLEREADVVGRYLRTP